MRAYTELLVRDLPPARARSRSAAWRPSSRAAATPRSTSAALAKVREDKTREAGDGFDGSWVAHPDLVPVCREVFDARPRRPAQPARPAARRRPGRPPSSCSTSRGVAGRSAPRPACAANVDVGVALPRGVAGRQRRGRRSTTSWRTPRRRRSPARRSGSGCTRGGARCDTGETVTAELVRAVLDEELAPAARSATRPSTLDAQAARGLFEQVALADDFVDFLTLPAYERSWRSSDAGRDRRVPRRRLDHRLAAADDAAGRATYPGDRGAGSRCTPATSRPTVTRDRHAAGGARRCRALLDGARRTQHGPPGVRPEAELGRRRSAAGPAPSSPTEPIEDLRVDFEDGYGRRAGRRGGRGARAAARAAGRARATRRRPRRSPGSGSSASRRRPGGAACAPSTSSSASSLAGGRAAGRASSSPCPR